MNTINETIRYLIELKSYFLLLSLPSSYNNWGFLIFKSKIFGLAWFPSSKRGNQ